MRQVFAVLGVCVLCCVSGFVGCSKKKTKIDMAPSTAAEVRQERAPEKESLEPIDMGDETRKVLVPVYFDYDKYDLRADAIETLSRIAPFLAENSSMRIMLEGHADERGTDEYNVGLGENRARSVKKYLTKYGLPAKRFEMVSYGKTRPVNPNCLDEECHGRNRRVEWKVLSE